MTFKERMRRDLKKIAFNEKELGEWHDIDGKRVCVVIDNDTLKQRSDSSGIDFGVLLYFVPVGNLVNPPIVGGIQFFDKKEMTVTSVTENMGLLEITLSQNGIMLSGG